MTGSGQFGYTDFDRVESWDGPGLANSTYTILANNEIGIGPLDCSRYSYMCGEILNADGYAYATFVFYLDPETSIRVGSFTLPINSGVGIGAVLHIPCLGPFCQVTLFDVSGSDNNVDVVLYASNRGGWSPFNLAPGQFIVMPWQTLNPGDQVFTNSAVSLAGDCKVVYQSDGTIDFAVEALDTGGNWEAIWQGNENTAGTGIVLSMAVPSGPVRTLAQNLGGTPQNASINLTTDGTAFP